MGVSFLRLGIIVGDTKRTSVLPFWGPPKRHPICVLGRTPPFSCFLHLPFFIMRFGLVVWVWISTPVSTQRLHEKPPSNNQTNPIQISNWEVSVVVESLDVRGHLSGIT